MIAADALVAGLAARGVTDVFANPGTSELALVRALEAAGMRAHLVLQESVATGAADGFARISGRPAAALMHLGIGLANGLVSLQNARRTATPVIVLVGDHTRRLASLDPPSALELRPLAASVSKAVRTLEEADDPAAVAAWAVDQATSAHPGVVTLIVPMDLAARPAAFREPPALRAPEASLDIGPLVDAIMAGEGTTLLLGGSALWARGIELAARIRQYARNQVLTQVFPGRVDRVEGLPGPTRLAYFAEFARPSLASTKRLVLLGARHPVPFFDTEPDIDHLDLLAPGTEILGDPEPTTALAYLEAIVAELGLAPATRQRTAPPAVPSGTITPEGFASVVAASVAPGTIVVDESQTLGVYLDGALARAPDHTVLYCANGAALGEGLPLAIGASVADPTRPVLALVADGSFHYSEQALFTIARLGLPIRIVILTNDRYGILELTERFLKYPDTPEQLYRLTPPTIDRHALAAAYGIPAERVTTLGALARALARPGPRLIDARF
jgi:acetolactate synthase-1/2/3 large subunit